MKQNGAKIIVDCLIEQGVEYVFGYPGGQIIDTFDALYNARDKITQILTAHEQGASHAADGYARVTGKTGVVIATSGPGATNLVTGIANAYMDSVPMVAITGNVPVSLLGRDSFQEVDIAGVTMPVTKHNYLVKDVAELADTIREAFYIANSGRPGPVLIDVPKNVQQGMFDFEFKPVKKYTPKLHYPQKKMDKAIELINESKKPLIYIGGGCIISNASNELIKFAEKLDAPVASSMMGLGAMPSSHPLYLGMIGMHGHAGVAKSLKECDTIIAIGARFSDRVTGNRDKFGNNKNIVHIDVDIAEIDKNVSSTAFILGDVKTVLKNILSDIKKKENPEWLNECHANIEEFPLKRCGTELCPRTILQTLKNLSPANQVVATDVGQHQMWTAQSYDFEKPRTFVTSGGLGTMGFGLGAAIGASFATKKPTYLITSEGSFHMNLNELATAVKHNLPIKIFLFHNKTLGMVRQWQTLFYGKRYSATDLSNLKTDYMKLAEAFGAKGFKIDKDEDVESVIKKALATDGPVIVECKIVTDAYVLPMVPPGKTTDDIITELEEE